MDVISKWLCNFPKTRGNDRKDPQDSAPAHMLKSLLDTNGHVSRKLPLAFSRGRKEEH